MKMPWSKGDPAVEAKDDHFITAMPGVVRIETKGGSHIEPAFDQSWPVEKRLAWKLAVVALDGFEARLYDTHYTINGRPVRPPHYGISFANTSISGGNEQDVWRSLSDLSMGYRAGIAASSTDGSLR